LTVQPVGSSFTGAVTLGCTTGLPVQAQCLFSPSTAVTPGNSAIDVVMNISTTPASGSSLRRPAGHPAIWLVTAVLLPGILIVPVAAGRRRSGRMRGLLVLLVSIFLNLSMFVVRRGQQRRERNDHNDNHQPGDLSSDGDG